MDIGSQADDPGNEGARTKENLTCSLGWVPIKFSSVIPAKAGIQSFKHLDTGFRRCDGLVQSFPGCSEAQSGLGYFPGWRFIAAGRGRS